MSSMNVTALYGWTSEAYWHELSAPLRMCALDQS